MPDRDLDARIAAVERALTDGDTDLTDLQDATAVADDLDDLAARVDEIESRLDDLEAGLQAVRGYAGNVRAVNREVERRASAALAKAEALETAVDEHATAAPDTDGEPRTKAHRESADRVAPADAHEDPRGSRGQSAPSSSPREPTAEAAGVGDTEPHRSARAVPDSDPAVDRTDRRVDQTDRVEAKPRSNDSARGRPTSGGGSREPRSTPDAGGDPEDPPEDGGASQTEQFIERVRDAL